MTDHDFAAIVRGVVQRWIQVTNAEQRQTELANPANLTAELALAVQHALVGLGQDPGAVRNWMLRAPFAHLKGAFDPAELVSTPSTFFPVPLTAGTAAGRAAALAVHGILQLETVSYGTENDGNLFVNLVTIPGSGVYADKSRKSMRGHTDGVSFPLNGDHDAHDERIAPSPDVVTLVGLRNPRSVPTKVMTLADVLARLSPNDINELKKPQYSIRSQKTFIEGMKRILGRELVVVDEAVLKDVAAGTYVRYSHSSVIPSVEGGPAEQASNNLEAACNEVAQLVTVEPGDILMINNRLGLHGRGEVGEEVGGVSRWLLRTYGLDASALPAYKRHLGGRPPHVLFP